MRPPLVVRLLILACLMARAEAAPAGLAAAEVANLPPAAEIKTDFARDIQPLLADHCVKCHGPRKQKGGLRLDNRTSAFQGGDEGKGIVPGKSADSRLIHLVSGLEPDTLMPPEDGPLTANQIGLLRAWIDQGASWPEDGPAPRLRSDHWSLQALEAPAFPGNPPDVIDTLVSARLAKDGLALSPEADRATLIRRVSFDLTGLPPSPEEIDAFVHNPSPQAWPELVERLLASPHYGERWGRHWLDVARFTESQGFEYDRIRDNAWHYRDYVIRSFNEDKPYDRFMREQVAGDVLEPVTLDGMVAPSLLVCGPWDQAGNAQSNATQKMITREDELEDLLGVVGQSFLGLTINCARCHTHKFDPIPHTDYYRLKAVFEGVRHGERELAVAADVTAHQERRAGLEKLIAAAAGRVSLLEAAAAKLAAAKRPRGAVEPGPAAMARWAFDGSDAAAPAGGARGGAVLSGSRLELAKPGAYYQSSPLSREIREKTLEAWVSLATLDQSGGAAISIESADGRVFDAIVFGERQPRKWTAGSDVFARTRDLDIPEETAAPDSLVHMAVVYRADNSIALFRNGQPLGPPYTPGSPLQTFAAGDARVLLGLRHHGAANGHLTGAIARAALYDRALTGEEVAASFRAGGTSIPPQEILACLTPDQAAARDAALAEIHRCRTALDALTPPAAGPSYVGTRVQPAPTRRLVRGEVGSPDEVVTPGALSAITTLDPDFGLAADAPEAERRLKFAAWLADPRNPLPARVMVNRLWQFHFGQGLVATPNDFGVSGSPPSHPELLDWLAVKFIESGWSVKAQHRLIVQSATYRQASAFNPEAAALDADNRLLWRYSPRRLEAEAVRDAMLAASGQLNPAMGGPGFRPFKVTEFGASFYQLEDRPDPEFNRRTVYRVNVNSGKDPLLDAFDCPDPAVKAPRRGVTTTPLQALGLMNNPFVQRQADHLAKRAMAGAGNDLAKAVDSAYRLALGRPPAPDESARAIAAATGRDLASVCWALLNSTEFVYVR